MACISPPTQPPWCYAVAFLDYLFVSVQETRLALAQLKSPHRWLTSTMACMAHASPCSLTVHGMLTYSAWPINTVCRIQDPSISKEAGTASYEGNCMWMHAHAMQLALRQCMHMPCSWHCDLATGYCCLQYLSCTTWMSECLAIRLYYAAQCHMLYMSVVHERGMKDVN